MYAENARRRKFTFVRNVTHDNFVPNNLSYICISFILLHLLLY